jgi:diguanylate cyclase (GGDEF)-like protein
MRYARPALALCSVLVALATAVSAVDGWRSSRDQTNARQTYLLLRAGAVHEAAYLRALRTNPTSTSARRSFFKAAQTETQLLAAVDGNTPSRQGALVRKIESIHSSAVATAARAIDAHVKRDARFAQALHQLDSVELHSAAAQNDLGLGDLGPWPATIPQKLGAGDLAIVLIAGLLLFVRSVVRAAGLRPAKPVGGHAELERLTHAAHSDSLTGLANHRAFQDDLAAAIERRNASGNPFSLLAFDLDGLKQINDVQGHPAGDAYIRTVAGCIRDEVGARGRVYRTGGDEFMAVLPDCRGWNALTVAHSIQRSSNEQTGRRALSIGITESTRTESRRVLLHQADLALYEAKRAKLLAVSYHQGLEPRQVEAGSFGPSEHQKSLAAALAQAVDARDAGTHDHSETVAELCARLGMMLGITDERLERLRIAGLLHDVGKIGVSDAVLTKPSALAPEERIEVEMHTTLGHSILASAGLKEESDWVLHHHERIDGGGYPTGLAGDAIPFESRIIAVADAFEARTGSRPYRSALTPEDALAELALHSGTQFDPRCVQALNELFGGRSLSQAVPADGTGSVVAIARSA